MSLLPASSWSAVPISRFVFSMAFDSYVQACWEAALSNLPPFARSFASFQVWYQERADSLRSGFNEHVHGRSHVGTPCVASEAHAQPPRKRVRGKQTDKHAAATQVKPFHHESPDVCLPAEVVDVPAEPSSGCFRVRCMAALESPDPRVALERELRTLAGHLREHPSSTRSPRHRDGARSTRS